MVPQHSLLSCANGFGAQRKQVDTAMVALRQIYPQQNWIRILKYLPVPELKTRDGLRLVIVKGTPSPWGQAAKAMIEYKGLSYTAGLQIPRVENVELLQWAGTNSGPVVAWNDEKPINNWLAILNLLERLEPDRSLLPADRALRSDVIGLGNEICGELGLGWNRRLSLYRPAISSGAAPQAVVSMGQKYGYNDDDVSLAVARQIAGLELLAQRLDRQHAQGSEYLVGDSLTAVDFYWAAFSTIFILPPADWVPLGVDRRPMFATIEPEVAAAIAPSLIAHRDRILQQHFKLPMEF